MDQIALYDDDPHAWALQQAAVLRRLAASGAALPNDLDLEHVAEEIEDLGNEPRFQVEGNLAQAFAHLIKLAVLPDDQAVRGWLREGAAFLRHARRRYRPSMRQRIDLSALWRDACLAAREDLELDGHDPPALPDELTLALETLLDRRLDARATSGCFNPALWARGG